ncbi:unnamed protein product, partial [Medioppia subpectinata]
RNFCANTCGSCKAFFRRSALKSTEFIRSETENEVRKQIYREKRQKKLLENRLKNCVDLSETDSNQSKQESIGIDSNNSNESNEIDEWIDSIDDKELSEQIDEIMSYITEETEAMKQIRQKSAAMAIVPIVKPMVDYCGINQLESSRITELSDASLVLNYPPLSDNRVTITGHLEMMIVTNGFFETNIQNIITFTKRLRGFQKFCADDQLALVKHGLLDITFLRGFKYYDIQNQDENNTLTVGLCDFKDHKRNTYDMILLLISKLLPEWDQDDILMDLLTAIVLLNPKRPNLLHRQTIKLEQQLYLLLKCGSESESKPRLQALMNSLTDLSITAESHKRYELSEVAENSALIQYYGPLFREIYDL